jgi:hypothetical protein
MVSFEEEVNALKYSMTDETNIINNGGGLHLTAKDDPMECDGCHNKVTMVWFKGSEGKCYCVNCIPKLHTCSGCGEPRHFQRWEEHWGPNYTCYDSLNPNKKLVAKEGPENVSIIRGINTYITDVINVKTTDKSRGIAYVKRTFRFDDNSLLIPFVATICSTYSIGTVKVIQHFARKADVEEAIDAVLRHHRLHAMQCYEARQIDRDNIASGTLSESNYFKTFAASEKHVFSNAADDLTYAKQTDLPFS